jgi:hypothetical protein
MKILRTVMLHLDTPRRHNVLCRHKICTGAASLRPMSARSIRSKPVAAIASRIAGFRVDNIELGPKGI